MTYETENLSLVDVFADVSYCDWSECDPETGEPRYTPVLPAPDESALDEYWPDWREDPDALAEAAETGQTELGAALDLFEDHGGRGYDEWVMSFDPVMNFAWPITPRHDLDPTEAATRIDRAAGCVTLVESEDWTGETVYFLALTGGGMDLSWNICAAYAAAGNVPPVRLLRDLPHMAGPGSYGATVRDEWAKLVLAGQRRAAEHLRRVAGQLDSDWSQRVKAPTEGTAGPVAQGPEGNGHDLPSCRACGWPGSDDHENCPNCAPEGGDA